jgi:hypothetical protein
VFNTEISGEYVVHFSNKMYLKKKQKQKQKQKQKTKKNQIKKIKKY